MELLPSLLHSKLILGNGKLETLLPNMLGNAGLVQSIQTADGLKMQLCMTLDLRELTHPGMAMNLGSLFRRPWSSICTQRSLKTTYL